MDITSTQNPRVKHIVKLREDKRQRQRDGLMLVEGFDELTLALRCGLIPQTLLTAPELASRALTFSHPETLTVSRAVFEKISHRENPDGPTSTTNSPSWMSIEKSFTATTSPGYTFDTLFSETLAIGSPPPVQRPHYIYAPLSFTICAHL